MKFILIVAGMAVALGASAPVLASTKLAEAKQCVQCHAVDRDTIGPSFRTIRSVYRGVKDPERRLVEVIQQGSDANLGPHWGRARMPNASERPLVSDREARQLARWILSGQP